ncbi:HTH-type transcriptional regulator MhqR [compost metagenome]
MLQETSPYSQAPEPFLRPLRALSEAYNAFASVGSRHIESLGLTPAQFDVLATLGDTPGMTCKQLGEGTLITKGTLTGVLDRLEAKGLIRRTRGEQDSRQVFVALTPEGEAVFQQTFQPHIDFLGRYMAQMSPEQQQQLTELLRELRRAFL